MELYIKKEVNKIRVRCSFKIKVETEYGNEEEAFYKVLEVDTEEQAQDFINLCKKEYDEGGDDVRDFNYYLREINETRYEQVSIEQVKEWLDNEKQ